MPFLTEADTCRRYVLPKLYAAGWTDEQISEQKSFTDGRIVVAGSDTDGFPTADDLWGRLRAALAACVETVVEVALNMSEWWET
jgi:type I site-specific restriction endonuclease